MQGARYMKKLSILIFIVLSLSSLSSVVHSETLTIVCDYKNYTSDDGFHKVKDKFILTFVLDKSNGKSYMIGNQGSTEVTILRSGEGYTFIEITGSGNVMTTTIDSKLKTCHSRNSIILGKLIPTQYYGTAVIK